MASQSTAACEDERSKLEDVLSRVACEDQLTKNLFTSRDFDNLLILAGLTFERHQGTFHFEDILLAFAGKHHHVILPFHRMPDGIVPWRDHRGTHANRGSKGHSGDAMNS